VNSILKVTEVLFAAGHPNIIGKHRTTFEITRDNELTKRGDCVIAVRATRGLNDLSAQFKNLCRNENAIITVELQAGEIEESIEGMGSPRLTLSHMSEIVGRRSTYTSERTLMIRADKAACDISRDLINALKSPAARVRVEMTVEL